MELKERLKELRETNKLRQKDIAQILNVRNTTVSAWEKGDNEPDIKTIKKLSQFFDVSADYLLGLENEDGTKTYETDIVSNTFKGDNNTYKGNFGIIKK
jgi:transcriptional regulator with XRE-family HTH domain